MKAKGILSLGLGLLAFLAGCTTAHYTGRESLNHIPIKKARELENLAKEGAKQNTNVEFAQSENAVTYDEAEKVLGKYQTLPRVYSTLTFSEPDNSASTVLMNTTGPHNLSGNVRALERLEGLLGESGKTTRLVLGEPDKDLVSARSGQNQFTSRSGLYGVDYHAKDAEKSQFKITACETTGIKNGNTNSEYHILFEFGKTETELIKQRRDWLAAINLGRDGAIGYGVANVPGVGGVAIWYGGSMLYAGVEGRNPSKTTSLSDDSRHISSLGTAENNVVSTLEEIERTGATQGIVFEYDGGKAIIRGDGFKDIRFDRDNGRVYVTTDKQGYDWLKESLYQGVIGQGSRVLGDGRISGHDINKVTNITVTSSGGGRTAGPGGGSSSGGSSSGGAGGR